MTLGDYPVPEDALPRVIQEINQKMEEGLCPVHDADAPPGVVDSLLREMARSVPPEYGVACICGVIIKQPGEVLEDEPEDDW